MLKKVGEEEGGGLETDDQTFRWIVHTTREACGADPGEGGRSRARARRCTEESLCDSHLGFGGE